MGSIRLVKAGSLYAQSASLASMHLGRLGSELVSPVQRDNTALLQEPPKAAANATKEHMQMKQNQPLAKYVQKASGVTRQVLTTSQIAPTVLLPRTRQRLG